METYFRAVLFLFLIFELLLNAVPGQGSRESSPPVHLTEQQIVEKLENLGGEVFKESGRVVEVNLGRTHVGDQDLSFVGLLADVTDLSLEQTQVGDPGIVYLERLVKLETDMASFRKQFE